MDNKGLHIAACYTVPPNPRGGRRLSAAAAAGDQPWFVSLSLSTHFSDWRLESFRNVINFALIVCVTVECAAVAQDFHDKEEAREETEAEQAYSLLDPHAHRQHHPLQRQAPPLAPHQARVLIVPGFYCHFHYTVFYFR